MRYLRYAFLAVLAICLVTVALANRAPVTLRLMSDQLSGVAGISPTITLPLFLVIFGGIIAGILIGFVWEWFREHKHRAEAAFLRRQRQRLEKEVVQLRGTSTAPGDDVLALLDAKG
jgi:putative membrane protein